MAEQIINVGSSANDGTGDTVRVAFTKAKANFAELYAGAGSDVTLSGTQTLTNKTISGASNTLSNIPASAILVGDTEEFDPDLYALLNSPTFGTRVTTPLVKITSGSPGAGKVLTSDADGDATWETPGSGSAGSIRLTKFEFFTDFVSAPISNGSAIVGPSEAALIVSGTGATASVNTTSPVANRPGVVTISAGTTTSGYAAIFAGAGLRAAGGAWIFETAVRIPTLSTSGERFVIKAGLLNEITAIPEINAISFVYDEGGVGTGSAATANWQYLASDNTTRTYVTSSIAVAANTWIKLRIEINAAATSAQFYVDGVSAGAPITTNIPGSTRNLNLVVAIFKSAGTTARTADWDYLYGDLTFTSAR